MAAAAWIADATNGAVLDTNVYKPVMNFDSTATGDTMYYDFRLPSYFSSLDSVQIFVATDSTNGDSCTFGLTWLGRAAGEAHNVAFATAQSDTVDIGTTATARTTMGYTGSFSNLAADDEVLWKIYRDNSGANNSAGIVYVSRVVFFGKGIK